MKQTTSAITAARQILRQGLAAGGAGTPVGEIDRQCLDSTRIRERLGWQPRWSLDDGLRETYAWYARNLERLPVLR